MLICPDHPTPIAVRTHVSDPVPYLLYDSEKNCAVGVASYDEDSAKASGVYVERGTQLMQKLLRTAEAKI